MAGVIPIQGSDKPGKTLETWKDSNANSGKIWIFGRISGKTQGNFYGELFF